MKRSLTLGLTALIAWGLGGGAAAAWTRTYAIEWNEPAMYYGAKTGVIDPGADCPEGSNHEPDWVSELIKAGYSPAEAKWLRDPANPSRSPVHGQNQMAFRGKDRVNVYTNPTSTPESGVFKLMTGKIAEGVNLDDDLTTGFISPTGEKGVDNAFYKTLGCWKTYRGPQRLSSGALQFNDAMREGAYTVLIVVSGKGVDPMNDGDVDVGFYMSADKLVKDGKGDIASDYTFRIKPDAKYEALFKAKTVKGRIVSTLSSDKVMMRDPGYTRDLELLKARISLEMKADGGLKGYVGGYRPWLPVYQGWVGARGPVIEALTWVRLPDVYYALRRNADYSPTGAGGEKTHISFALRVEAVPAFVMTPDASREVTQVESYKGAAAPPPPAPTGVSFRIIDGLVPDAKVPFGDALKVYPPPAAAAPSASVPNGGN